MKNKKVLIVLVVIIAVLILIAQYEPIKRYWSISRPSANLGEDQCKIESNFLTCGHSYQVLSKGVEKSLEENIPFDISSLSSDASLLTLMDKELSQQLSATDNIPATKRQPEIEKIKSAYAKNTGRSGIYLLYVADGIYTMNEETSQKAVSNQIKNFLQ